MTNEGGEAIFRGRCIGIGDRIRLLSEAGVQELPTRGSADVRIGDIVEVSPDGARVLTPNRAGTTHWAKHVLDPRRLHALARRSRLEEQTRAFFRARKFIETRTPLIVPSPGMEPHIRPFQVSPTAAPCASPAGYLPTSPEFAMKRLLAGGLERIFQLSQAFRDEPRSRTHLREFTMLEWYRAYAGYLEIMKDVEELFAAIAIQLNGEPAIFFQGKRISLAPPWPRLRVRDLFKEIASVDLARCSTKELLAKECQRLGLAASPDFFKNDTWDDLFFRIWLNVIEPALPEDRAVFVTDYPASQAALAVVAEDPDGMRFARRFEAFAGGLELGNAFEELTDPREQRLRFEKDMALRKMIYGDDFPSSPIDEEFLGALEEGMPPAGGIAVGFDRMVMLFADEPEIDYTVWLS